MKMFYENPEMDVVLFAAEDVITTSGSTGGGLIDGGEGDGPSIDWDDIFG